MQKIGLNEIREKYLAFFEGKEHLRQQSFSLVPPEGDASLLLINSGMAPLKPYFSGEAVPPHNRMTSCQKCVRVIDIEQVGKTDRHCTFFEMLGHFSFGDYFKREAITWTWEFFTEVMGIPKELLYCSVYLEDDEAWDIWTKEIGIPESHMARLGKADNFWDVGSGPCGPCSEIYYDRGDAYGCGSPDCKVGCECDRFVEVGNNVFTQFSNDGQGNYSNLAQKNIDFGMGLERLACVVQGTESVFEVDTITKIRRHVSKISGVEYKKSDKTDISIRIITDHIRSTVMLICDGVQPSNEKRGYVLRRLLRRAARHGRLLGVEKPFLCDLAATVIEESGGAYPELRQRGETIKTIIRIEEERFLRTIDAGLAKLSDEIAKVSGGGQLGADKVFLLYDTYGFPVDLTMEILSENGLTFDRGRFDELMEGQRTRAREARAELGISGWQTLDLGLDKSISTEFSGYNAVSCEATVLAAAESVIVLDKTPFYAESGGQCADTGRLRAVPGNGMPAEFRVDSVKKSADGKILHIGEVVEGEFSAGLAVSAEVDAGRREAVMRAHSATHLLHKALRAVLGTHVEQAGSQVEPDRIRFDYSHFQAPAPEQLAKVEMLVNADILKGYAISMEEMSAAQAKERGAMALFTEKYGDVVRVVTMGESVELCGGTHLDSTAKAGSFRILAESSIAAGIRRVEAVTGLGVIELTRHYASQLRAAADSLKTSPEDLCERITSYIAEHKRLQKENSALQGKLAGGLVDELLQNACEVNGFMLVVAECSADLRETAEKLRDKMPRAVALLYTEAEGKLSFCAACGPEAVKRGVKAGDIVREAAIVCGGKGGGRPDVAMGGAAAPVGGCCKAMDGAADKIKEILGGIK
jgi:alanyl-tRNA synthetase